MRIKYASWPSSELQPPVDVFFLLTPTSWWWRCNWRWQCHDASFKRPPATDVPKRESPLEEAAPCRLLPELQSFTHRDKDERHHSSVADGAVYFEEKKTNICTFIISGTVSDNPQNVLHPPLSFQCSEQIIPKRPWLTFRPCDLGVL